MLTSAADIIIIAVPKPCFEDRNMVREQTLRARSMQQFGANEKLLGRRHRLTRVVTVDKGRSCFLFVSNPLVAALRGVPVSQRPLTPGGIQALSRGPVDRRSNH